MNKVLICYFSGTNNTKTVAEMIKQGFENTGYQTDLYNIRLPYPKLPDLNEYAYIGFGYPVHAFNTPQFFLKWIKTIPEVKNLKAFIFKTSGEPFRFNDASSFSLVKKLQRKGFTVLSEGHFLMPYNIMFRYPDVITKHMYIHNRTLAKVFVSDVIANKRLLPKYYPWTVIFAYLARLQWLGAKINGPLIHVKKHICTACGKCIKNCPSHNIKMVNGYPKFDSKCTMCMSCVSLCPEDAVRPGVLNGWRVNGLYDFKAIAADETVPFIKIDRSTTGYFRLFRRYYEKSYAKINSWLKEREQK